MTKHTLNLLLAYEPKVLKLFAKHYKTGETLPDLMIEKLVRSKNFLSAMAMLRQLEFSLFDFILHTKLYQEEEIQKLAHATAARCPVASLFQATPDLVVEENWRIVNSENFTPKKVSKATLQFEYFPFISL